MENKKFKLAYLCDIPVYAIIKRQNKLIKRRVYVIEPPVLYEDEVQSIYTNLFIKVNGNMYSLGKVKKSLISLSPNLFANLL